MKSVIAFLLVLGALFFAVGAGTAHYQHSLIRRSLPVSATVVSSRVQPVTSGRSTTYRPAVEFRYEVGGKLRTADTVFPLSISTSNRRWVESIVARFPAGKTVEAYYDSRNLDRAFLLRQHDFFPYLFAFVALPFLCAGGAILSLGKTHLDRPAAPVPAAGGWFEVPPAVGLTAKQRAAWVVFGIWDTLGFATLAHYVLVASPPFETAAWVTGGVFLGAGAALAAMAIYFTNRARLFGEARVFIHRPQLKRGEPVTVAVRQKLYDSLSIQETRLALVCQETQRTSRGRKSTISTRTVWEQAAVPHADLNAMAGQALEASVEFAIPAEQMPSTPPTAKGYPRYSWKLDLTVKVPGKPDYRAGFPVFVM